MQIDHVMYGVRDLSEASARFADSYGLPTLTGGSHPQWGTANAIIPVGNGQYVELIAVADPTSDHPIARFLTALTSEGDRPVAVCLRPDDLDATAHRLGLQISEGERVKDDGEVVRWRLAGVPDALGPDRLPFFIEWPRRGSNPELADVAATVGYGIESVEFGGDADTLRHWVGEDLSAIRAVQGERGVSSIAIRRADKTLVLNPR